MMVPSCRSLLPLAAMLLPVMAIHNFKGLNTVADLEALYLVKDGKATKPLLLSFSNPDCYADVVSLGFPQDFFDMPDAVFEIAQVQYSQEKGASTNELTELFQVDGCTNFVYLAGDASLDNYEKLVPSDTAELASFFWDHHRYAGFAIVNDLEIPINIFWEGRFLAGEHRVMSLKQGTSQVMDTFLGHTFVFRDEDDRLLARKVITGPGELRLSDVVEKQCRVEEEQGTCEGSNTETLQRTQAELEVWRGRISSNVGRLRQNEEQPSRHLNYAPVGFKKMRVPEPAWSAIKTFYAANKVTRIKEPWEENDTHVNFWESMTTMTYISEEVRQTVFNTLRPVLEEWVGGMELDPTSCYGIRLYYNNSWLRDHVDVGETHIVSAIINVEQDVDKDWPLMILDHDGNRHQVTMEPGDMVLYESATKIHGRPQPLFGREYANVFTHFRPLEWARRGSPQIQDEEDSQYMEEQ